MGHHYKFERVPGPKLAGGPTFKCRRCGFTKTDGGLEHDCDANLARNPNTHRREYKQRPIKEEKEEGKGDKQ